MKNRFFVRTLIGVLVLVLGLLVSACASSPVEQPADVPDTETEVEEVTDTETEVEEVTDTGTDTEEVSQPDEPFVVVVAQADDPPTLDPQKPGGPTGGNLAFNLFDGLVIQSPDMQNIMPGLATEWKMIDDLTWQFKLREGVKFHNGEDFNAEAVRYTVARILEPDTVRNLYDFGHVDTVEIIDDYTVNIKTKTPDPIFPVRTFGLSILPPIYAAEVGEEEFGINPIGTGPFRLVEYIPDERIVLEAFDDYWNGRPEVDQLILKPVPEASTRVAELQAGTADIILQLSPDEVSNIDSAPDLRVTAVHGKRVPFVGLDLLPDGPEELKDKRVRQALNYAVDVDLIVEAILGGYGQTVATIFRPDFLGYDPDLKPYPYNPEKAMELLAEAGYPDGFSMKTNASDQIFNKGLEVAEAIAGMLQEVGIDAEVAPVAHSAFRDLIIGGQEVHKNEGMFVWNWGSREPDADSPLKGFLHSDGITSYVRDPKLDEMIESARSEMDSEARKEKYREIQEYIYEEAPVIFLYVQDDLYGVNERIDWAARRDQYVLGIEMSQKDE